MKMRHFILGILGFWVTSLNAQPQNLQTTTLINLSFDNITLLGFGSNFPIAFNLPNTFSIDQGANLEGPTIATSSTQYLQYTIFGSTNTSKSISVSIQSPLLSDYYYIEVEADPIQQPLYGSNPTDHSPIVLSTVPKTWLSGIYYGATGSGPMDGISFTYKLMKNPSGSYSTLSGAGENVTILYTIVE